MTAPGAAFGLDRIGQIALTTKNLDRAVAYYRDVLGMKHLFDAPGMAFFDCGGIRLMLAPPDKPELDHPGSILYFKTDDIHAPRAALKGRGVEFVEKPHVAHRTDRMELWLAFFRDVDGNLLALMSETARG